MGSMLPFSRTHSAKGTAEQEPWSFGSEVEKISQIYIKLRYRFMPYFYTYMIQACKTGILFIFEAVSLFGRCTSYANFVVGISTG